MKSFNALEQNLDIHNNTLLEASAGTGKTFSIENIFVRLLLENNPVLKAPLKINDILVVTFTRASTADLRHRIRKNIERCLNILRESLLNPSIEYEGPYQFLNNFIEQGPDYIKEAFNRLEDALYCFDQSQIFTIHAFCSKMLRENVFEGDMRVDIKIEEQISISEMQRIVRNFFRTELVQDRYCIAQLDLAIKSCMGKYENLENTILRLINQGAIIKKSRSFTELQQSFEEQMNLLKRQYNFNSEKILSDFNALQGNYKKVTDINDGYYRTEKFAKLFNKNILKLIDDRNIVFFLNR